MTQRFIAALGRLEQDRDVEPLVALHADGSDVGNVNAPEGVSILEINGDTIARFRAYFDPGKLGRQMAG
jgi:hypothetical protein